MEGWIHSVGEDWEIWAHPQGIAWKGWFQTRLFNPSEEPGSSWDYNHEALAMTAGTY